MNEFNEDQDILTAALPSLTPIRQSGPEINKLYAALFAAKKAMSPAKKTAENPYFNSKYADLLACMKSWDPPLHDNGLMLIFLPFGPRRPFGDLAYINVIGRLVHESGEWIECEMGSPCSAGGQAIGSLITYFKRYLGQALLALPSEDDDGNAAQPKPQAAATPLQVKTAQAQGLAVSSALETPADIRSTVIPFGKNKGRMVSDQRVEDTYLTWLIEAKQQNLDDPNYKYRADAGKLLAAAQAELAYRKGEDIPI